eukprot:m.61399 g.61399  ORF g.61399 m.61399 type:complete len:88 (+) comp11861_c0_seq1:1057-1320(+)
MQTYHVDATRNEAHSHQHTCAPARIHANSVCLLVGSLPIFLMVALNALLHKKYFIAFLMSQVNAQQQSKSECMSTQLFVYSNVKVRL